MSTAARPVVRRATLADAPALAALRWQWRVEEKGARGGSRDAYVADFATWWSVHATDHLAWVADDGSRPVGMAWLAVLHRVPDPARLVRLAGQVQSVYVVPEQRGAGLGEALVRAAIEHARDAGVGYLVVHPSELSFPVYRRVGFAETTSMLELGLHERV